MKLRQLILTRYLPHAHRTRKPRTAAEYERLARAVILPKLGDCEIDALTLDDIETWHAGVPGAVQANRALAVLSAALKYAVERRLLAHNPCQGLTRNPERSQEFYYAPEHTRAILNAALVYPGPQGRYIALCLLTGCRPSELLDLVPGWRTGAAVRLPDSKTGTRTIFLSPAAEAVLDRLTPDPKTGRYFPAGMSLRRAWDAIVGLAGVPRARLYSLRHTFASAALAAGTGLDVVGLMLGHRKRETTLRYAHLAPDVGVNAAAAAAVRMGAPL